MKLYECPIHDQDWHKHPECATCARIVIMEAKQREVNKRAPKIHKLLPQVYWPKTENLTDGGRVIEHLTPEPVFVRNKQEFRDLLKRTNSAEK